MMAEHILILYFEMTYPSSFLSSKLIGSHRLALHAKRVTVMPKDSEILRDLIFMWNPENFLAKGSKQRTDAWKVMGMAAAVKRLRQLDEAKAKKERLERLRMPVPQKLQHFLRGGVGRNEKDAPRRFASGIIGL